MVGRVIGFALDRVRPDTSLRAGRTTSACSSTWFAPDARAPPPGARPVGGVAARRAPSRVARILDEVPGEADPAIREMFRVASTTVPDLRLEDAGWEDD